MYLSINRSHIENLNPVCTLKNIRTHKFVCDFILSVYPLTSLQKYVVCYKVAKQLKKKSTFRQIRIQ